MIPIKYPDAKAGYRPPIRILSAVKKFTTAIPAAQRKTQPNPHRDQINPHTSAVEMEKTWSILVPMVSVGATWSGRSEIFLR